MQPEPYDFPAAFDAAKKGAQFATGIFEVGEVVDILKNKRGFGPFLLAMSIKAVKEVAWDKAMNEAKEAIVERMNYFSGISKKVVNDPEARKRLAAQIDELQEKLAGTGIDVAALMNQAVNPSGLSEQMLNDIDALVQEGDHLRLSDGRMAYEPEDASTLMSMGGYGRRVLDDMLANGQRHKIPLGVFKDMNTIEMERQQALLREQEEAFEAEHAPAGMSPGM